jgi:hypothetical protein
MRRLSQSSSAPTRDGHDDHVPTPSGSGPRPLPSIDVANALLDGRRELMSGYKEGMMGTIGAGPVAANIKDGNPWAVPQRPT